MQLKNKENTAVYIAIAAISVLIFGIDFFTRLGIAEWVFYIIPVVLCILQQRKHLPFVVAVIQTILITVGFFVSPDGVAEEIGFINRSFGVVAIFGVALLSYQVIVQRLRAQRLLWLQQGQAEIAASMLGEQDVEQVGRNLLRSLAGYLDAQVGLLHRLDKGTLVHTASFAFDPALQHSGDRQIGDGLAGEVARNGKAIIVSDLPDDYVRYGSMSGNAKPRNLLIAPVTAEGRIMGVLELGFSRSSDSFADEHELVALVTDDVGIAIRSALYRQHLKELLEETQRQSEELQTQQEELRVSNEELEEQGRVLRESQARLENQHAELEQTNVQLEEQTQRLERQKHELLQAQRTLEINAEALEKANRYKSEFLANMSHELRTPLNSSLILSHILADNKPGTLSEEQVRYAKTIHSSNNDLLALINDILDLSKIEAGHVEIQAEPVSVASVLEPLRQTFEPIAKDKGVAFNIGVSSDAPATFVTDNQRLQQILKNLLSNAFKFTESGEVVLHVASTANERLTFAVRDTGIGIPEHQQDAIFEAFHQADGTTSRKYGGTGLGLSISRELARLLDGEITVQSAAGLGSTFTLEISANLTAASDTASTDGGMTKQDAGRSEPTGPIFVPVTTPLNEATEPVAAPPMSAQVNDDRLQRKRERLILVIEDDERFADILYELAHELNFDCIRASTGGEAIRLAREYRPSGILLDVRLPDQSGLSVLERLKRDPATRHIPIHMVSVDDHVQTALELGAVGYALKPVAREDLIAAVAKLEDRLQKRARRVLIVEDDVTLRENIALLLKADDIDITTAGTVSEALERVSATTFDCMVMDLMLPDASGYDLLEQMAVGGKYSFPPVIVYTGRVLTRNEEQRLRRYSKSIIIKGARSPERLLDEVTLFLHRVEATLPPDQQKLLAQARQRDAVFEGRRILVAEDDVRNIFALSSILEPLGAKLEIARNGKEALDRLNKDADIDIVLMDLMMPEMDGLTAMREIRKRPEFSRLPIIALTAKAMADDRKNCLEAGANDYIAKPIDVDKLVSLCRVWMPK
jgi:CheY-like chemotaxis protein/putative methionine-R-sulfoxide reductase with GAF domain